MPDDAAPALSEEVLRARTVAHIGYQPNYYDYRVKSVDGCCGCMAYNYTAWCASVAVVHPLPRAVVRPPPRSTHRPPPRTG